jgi:hypothetical protein
MALLLGLVSLVSFFIMVEYIQDGGVSMGFGTAPCCLMIGAISFCVIVVSSILNISTAVSVSKRSKSKVSLRSLYISILYPIVLIAFIIPHFEAAFYTSLIFGFPVFVLGVILLPFSSFSVMREALKMDVKQYTVEACHYCRFTYRREIRQMDAICPRCGAYQIFTVPGRTSPYPTTPAGEGQIGENWQRPERNVVRQRPEGGWVMELDEDTYEDGMEK